MRIIETLDVFANGTFPASAEWAKVSADVEKAIKATDWPHGSGTFTIYPESGKKRDMGNGVVPIKLPCVASLKDCGWRKEGLPPEKQGVLRTGGLDALIETSAGWVGFEWETGNISSSHRALNKLIQALGRGDLVGGFLVVPSTKLAAYLTDRIGNIRELRPYLAGWGGYPVANGVLRIIVVEQDAESTSVPKIPKMTAGRAKG
ncbi:MAG: hypothetical protein Q8Q14_02230 [Gemmatimonadales bacterium]|nr:hypothetical protein [Gemmatimonadales bacterium]